MLPLCRASRRLASFRRYSAQAWHRHVRELSVAPGVAAPASRVVDLAAAFDTFSAHWSPKIVSQVNDMQMKVVTREGFGMPSPPASDLVVVAGCQAANLCM